LDTRASLARFFTGGLRLPICLAGDDMSFRTEVLKAGRAAYGDAPFKHTGASLERRVYKLFDRISPTVRKVAGATAGICTAVAYTHLVRAAHARKLLVESSEWLPSAPHP